MPTRFDFSGTIKAFSTKLPIRVYDAENHPEFGMDNWSDPIERHEDVYGIILMNKKRRLTHELQGGATDPEINITTKSTFYFPDAIENKNKQTFVDYGGIRYRITGHGDLKGNTTHHSYDAERWLM